MSPSSLVSFNSLRNAAHHRAEDIGIPSNRDEDWRYVDLSPLTATLQAHGNLQGGVVVPVGRSSEPGMVITNGCWDPSASPALPPGVDIHGISGDSVPGGALLEEWSRQLEGISDISAAWSFADMRSGLDIHITASVDRPLIMLNLATDASSAWRAKIHLEAAARAQILLIHLVAPQSRSCLGIDAVLEAGSHLAVDEVEFSTDNAQTLGQLLLHKQVQVQGDGELEWNSVSRGGVLVRHRWDIHLLQAGAAARCQAATMLDEGLQSHHHLRMHHAAGNTHSHQLFKQVLAAQSRASFDGLVRIEPGADDSHADQLCRSLLLDDSAFMGGRPQLEILADEVTATHGATVAQPQVEELLYLRSRGIPRQKAEQLLSDAFLGEVANAFSFPASRALARQQLARHIRKEVS